MGEKRWGPRGAPPRRSTVAYRGADSCTAGIAEVLERIAADQAAAAEARCRYRAGGMAPMDPGPKIGPLLSPGESLLAVRRAATLDRRDPPPEPGSTPGLMGDLVVTTHRLVLTGRRCVAFDLDDIEEAMLSGERLLLVMRNGVGLTLRVDQPRLLRVQIAAARVSRRT